MHKTSEKLNLYQIDLGLNLRLGREKESWVWIELGLVYGLLLPSKHHPRINPNRPRHH
jgi:hypothetical protein